MRSAPVILLLLSVLVTMGLSGCYGHPYRLGPPPPAYACDGYGCDGYDAYGGFSECVDDGQYLPRRDVRRQRRADRRASRNGGPRRGRAPTYNGLPVVAAYIMPMEMMGGGECMSGDCFPGGGMSCDGMMGDCMSGECMIGGDCMGCGDACGGGWQPCGDCQSCGVDSPYGPTGSAYDPQWQLQNGQPTPSEVYPQTYPYGGQELEPMPVPPAQEIPEGDFRSPRSQQVPPQTFPEPEARRPVQSTQWLPARLP